MDIIHIKFRKAIASLIHKRGKIFDCHKKDVSVITYDKSSQIHKFLEKIIHRSYCSISRTSPTIIYKSLPRVMELLCSKRKDIQNIRSYLEQVPDL
jgi:hypothetical protein